MVIVLGWDWDFVVLLVLVVVMIRDLIFFVNQTTIDGFLKEKSLLLVAAGRNRCRLLEVLRVF